MAGKVFDSPRRGHRYLIAMVGLPARGKTYTARKLEGYLTWLGFPTRRYNLGERRRERLGPAQPASFFDPSNKDAVALREMLADKALEDAFEWLCEDGRIAILDATNSTRKRRDRIQRYCAEHGMKLLFIELHESNDQLVDASIRATKLTLPDYANLSGEEAIEDFRARVTHYRRVYQSLDDTDGSWIRVEDRGRQVILHQARGWLIGRIASLLTNLAIGERPIWLTRHGESTFNAENRIGGDSMLTEHGAAYAAALAAHVKSEAENLSNLVVWTSTARRAVATATALGMDFERWRALDEIDAGICDSCTYEEIAARWPAEFEARKRDKLRYRYPGGESYEDVIARVDRVILEAESLATPVLIIAHQAVIRTLYAYFVQIPRDRVPFVEVSLHTVIKLLPTAYGCREERITL